MEAAQIKNDPEVYINLIKGKATAAIRIPNNFTFEIKFEDSTILTFTAAGTYCDALWLDVTIPPPENEWIA